MKLTFTFIAITLVIFALLLMTFSARKGERLSRPLSAHLGVASLAVLTYVVTIYVPENNLALLLYGIYYTLIDWVLISMLIFAGMLTKRDNWLKKHKTMMRIFLPIACVDIVANFVNLFTGWNFHLEKLTVGNEWFWDSVNGYGFYLHLLFCYFLILQVLIMLIINLAHAPKSFRGGYYAIFFFFAGSIVVNFISMMMDWHLNYSILLYLAIGITFFYFSFYTIPRESEYRMQALVSEQIDSAIACFDKDGRCIRMNAAARNMFRAIEEGNAVIERYLSIWLMIYNKEDKDVVFGEDVLEIEGKNHNYTVEYRRFLDSRGKVQGSYLKMDDRTEETDRLNAQKQRATHDALTGVYTRQAFMEQAAALLEKDPDRPRYLIATNIKDFRLINEFFGKEMADKILVKQAQMLEKANYDGVIIGRISADRFAMLIAKDNFNAEKAMQNTQVVTNLTEDMQFHIHIHLGIYEIANPKEDIHVMYEKAAAAVHSIENTTQTQLVFYDTFLMESLMYKKNVLNELESALKEGQFCIFLQPQVTTHGEVVGGEALARWIHPQRGLIPPYQFIPILEETGNIFRLDRYIWELAAAQLADWKEKGFNNYYISVNVSTKDFYYADLFGVFTGLVAKYQIDPSKLKLEITETTLMKDLNRHRTTLKHLSDYGFDIEMDDFGSGYSSLKLLEDLRVDVLKVDMEFLRKTAYPERAKQIVKSIISIAKKLDMQVITEGVEEEEQTKFLAKYGADLFQGYYFSKPIPVKEFEEKYLEEGKA